MIKISREVELALLLMAELAREESGEKRLSLKDWAKARNLPYRYLSKVAVKLKKARVLVSREGRGGGYSLKRKPEDIKVGEIIKGIEGPALPLGCLSSDGCEYASICGHSQMMKRLGETIEKQLGKVSIKDLC